MKRIISILILSLFVFVYTKKVHADSTWMIIENLKSEDPVKVNNTCKKLGLERGALGLSKVQTLQPHTEISRSSVFVIAISWGGPKDGSLILMDSKGTTLDKRNVGYINALSLIQLQPDGEDTLVVDAIKCTGSGIRIDQLHILSITKIGFKNLWEGLRYERSAPGLIAPDDNYEIKGRVIFEDLDNDGKLEVIYSTKRIEYKYDRKTGKFRPPVEKDKKTEVYWFNKERNLFLKSEKRDVH